jgi:hypothetical protein
VKNLFDYNVQTVVKNLFDYNVQTVVKNLFDYSVQNVVKNLADTSLTLSMTLSVITNKHSCHSERSEESCRYFADAQYDVRGHDGGSLHKDYKGHVEQTAGVRCLQKGNARPFTKKDC